ncbi:MAG TPA: hypothetical protein VIL97_10530, partial [Thermoanaerobaculia bacterium]
MVRLVLLLALSLDSFEPNAPLLSPPGGEREERAIWRVFGSAGYESQLTPANEDSPLNRDNALAIAYSTSLADVNVFTEVSTGDRKLKARIKLRGDASDRARDEIELGEGFVQLQATAWLDLTAGRVIEKWGTGYGWSPTAFVGPAKSPTDPNDRRSAYQGTDMIRADLFARETNLSLYTLEDGAFAARVYRMIGQTDLSVYAHRDEHAKLRAGASLSRVFGDALELHADITHSSDGTRALAGGQYTFANDVNFVLEVYHQDDGLSSDEWNAFRALADDPHSAQLANETYAPLRMGKDYAFVRLARPFARRKAEAEIIAIANLRDGSSVTRLALTYKIRPNLSAYLIETEFFGGADGELAYLQVARVTTAGVR